MANNIVLKTYKGGNVTPQDDAIIHEIAIATNGIFKGCEVAHARGNVLRISQGFGMIKGRFFEVYETEIAVQLADAGVVLDGRLYIHMDLSNVDEPIMILSATASELPALDADADVNYNNSSFDIELATFNVSSSEISNLTQTFVTIEPGSGGGGGGGGNSLKRDTLYNVGDTATVGTAPGWVTLYCTQAGTTAAALPTTYATIQSVGDSILDGTCVFEARNIIGELDGVISAVGTLETDMETLDKKVDDSVSNLEKRLDDALNSSGNLVTKIISLTDYKALESYEENCIYMCYEDSNTQEITHIYLGENTIFFEGANVTYQADTGESTVLHLDGGADAIAKAPSVAKEGYTLVGWRTDTEANAKVLSSYLLQTAGDVTLYAVFEKKIEVYMYPQGGTLIEGKSESTLEVECYYNNGNSVSSTVELPECPYEYEDMSFCGWTCGDTLYKPGDEVSFTEDDFIVPTWVTTVYDFQYTGTYTPFTIPADGIYEFEVWGAKGGDATDGTNIGSGGLGGHAKGYKKMTKGEKIYIFNGEHPASSSSGSCSGGDNGGGGGYTYSSSNHYGAAGGGATSIMYRSSYISSSTASYQSSNYANRYEEILIIAGGGGGGAITSAGVINPGGNGGGDRGGDGSNGALGGRQISTGSNDYTNFGVAPSYSGSNTTYSGGGGGFFAGEYDIRGESAGGGSGWVGGVSPFTHNKKYYGTVNEAGVNEGNGYAYIRYVEVC